jgi:hypothetical protein
MWLRGITDETTRVQLQVAVVGRSLLVAFSVGSVCVRARGRDRDRNRR